MKADHLCHDETATVVNGRWICHCTERRQGRRCLNFLEDAADPDYCRVCGQREDMHNPEPSPIPEDERREEIEADLSMPGRGR